MNFLYKIYRVCIQDLGLGFTSNPNMVIVQCTGDGPGTASGGGSV